MGRLSTFTRVACDGLGSDVTAAVCAVSEMPGCSDDACTASVCAVDGFACVDAGLPLGACGAVGGAVSTLGGGAAAGVVGCLAGLAVARTWGHQAGAARAVAGGRHRVLTCPGVTNVPPRGLARCVLCGILCVGRRGAAACGYDETPAACWAARGSASGVGHGPLTGIMAAYGAYVKRHTVLSFSRRGPWRLRIGRARRLLR